MRNFSESYDDIFPVSDEQFDFLIKTAENYPKPAKFLHIGSNTGNLGLALAKNGFEVCMLPVASDGVVDMSALEKEIDDNIFY